MGAQQSTRRLTVINDEASGVIKITDSVVDRIKSELQEQQAPPAATPAQPVPTPAPTPSPPPPAPEPTASPPPPPPPQPETGPPPPPPAEDVPPPPPPPPPPPIIKYIEKPAPPPEVIVKYIDKPPPPPEVVVKYVETPAPPPEIKYVEKPVVTYVDKVVEKPVVEYVDKPVVVEKVVERIIEKESGLTSLRIRAEKEKELLEAETYWRKRFAKQEQEHTTLAHLEVATMNETAERLSKTFSIQKFPPTCLGQREELLQCYKQNPDKTLLCSEVVKNFSKCVHSTRVASG